MYHCYTVALFFSVFELFVWNDSKTMEKGDWFDVFLDLGGKWLEDFLLGKWLETMFGQMDVQESDMGWLRLRMVRNHEFRRLEMGSTQVDFP